MKQVRGNFPLHPTQESFGMLVDIRENDKILPISVIFLLLEIHQLHNTRSKSYLGEIDDKHD